MLYLISYDIHDDKRRYRVAKILEGIGDRVQYSVFEAHLTETQLRQTRERLRNIIEPLSDSVRFYCMGVKYHGRIMIEGWGIVKEPLQYILI